MSTPRERAQRTIDSIFAHDGSAANYQPPSGPAVPCVIIMHFRDDDPAAERRGQARKAGLLIDVRVSEIAAPVPNGVFTLSDARGFTIAGKPICDDPEKLVWTCATT